MNVQGYHAHVYFEGDEQRAEALGLREELERSFPGARLGRVHAGPVAFHPTAMFQVAFEPALFGELVPWLMLHRRSLSVMVHPLTGDTFAEHTHHALWLGEPRSLDLARLRQIAAATRPERTLGRSGSKPQTSSARGVNGCAPPSCS